MTKLVLAAVLTVTTSGCLCYSRAEHPKAEVYAEITAAEIIGAAALALIPMDNDRENEHPGYGERFGVWLSAPLMIDAFGYLVTEKSK